MPFKLQTSGSLRLIHSPDGETSFPEKGLLIMAYMIAHGLDEEQRGHLARLIWGNLDQARAMTNLRQTIARITARQQELGVAFLAFDATTVRLDRTGLSSDLDLLHETETAGDAGLRERLGRAVSLYRFPFLADLVAEAGSIAPTLSQWIRERQEAYASAMAMAIQRALPQAVRPDELFLLREAALRLFRHSPENSDVQHIQRKTGVIAAATTPATPPFIASPPVFPMPENAVEHVSSALGVVRQLYDQRRFAEPVAITAAMSALAPSPPQVPRLAILPPAVNHGDGLVSALLEDVTIALCGSATVKIVAPYTAARISGETNKPRLILQHAISYVLDTKMGTGVNAGSLFVQLLHIPSDETIWAERLLIDESRLLQHRVRLVGQLCSAITSQLLRNETARRYYENNPQAYYHYLQGQSLLQHLTLPEIRRARKAFRAALQEKPDFGPALSGVARTNHLEWLVTARGDPDLLNAAERLAQQAIDRCGELTFGYRELGVTKLFLGGFDESVEALMAAERLSPQYADVIADLGDTLIHASRPAEGLAKLEQAIALNPETPDGYLWAAAGACYYLEDYFGGLAYIDRMQDKTPALRLAAASRAMLGDTVKAKALARKVREQHPDFDVDTWLAVVPIREDWQRRHYRDGLKRAGL